MESESRTVKSLRNSKIALIYSILYFILSFFSRKIFLDHLGTEVLGLNTTAVSLLQFLNLAELGICTAISCTLYKPLFDKDYKTINEIVSLQGWMYRKIAYIIIGCALILMCFFPMIFAKMALPLWYAYASFSVLLFSSLLSYFVNYKEIILVADQKQYKIVYSYNASMIFKTIFQMVAVSYFDNGYIWWLIIDFSFAIIAAKILNITIKKSAPFLKTNIYLGHSLSDKYPEIITKVKQLFIHKIAGIALSQGTPIIIYTFTTLTMVAYYGNYMLIIAGIGTLLGAIFNGTTASIGNLVAEGNEKRILNVFEELYSSRFFIVSILCVSVYYLAPQFITLWIGKGYIMDSLTLFLMVVSFFIGGTRYVVDSYINAYGIFHDIWAPLAETILNLGFSILLGYCYGINGVLLGCIISQIVIIMCWKPYFLFKRGLKVSINIYVKMFVTHMLVLAITVYAFSYINKYILVNSLNIYQCFIANSLTLSISFAIFLGICLYATTAGMRDFVHRFIKK